MKDNFEAITMLLLSNQSGPILWDPMDYSMPAFLVLHYLLEFELLS